MIIEALVGTISIAITGIIKLFPVVDSNTISSINSFYSSIKTSFASAAWIIPVDTVFLILGLIVGIELTVLTVRMIRWVVGIVSAGFIRA